MKVAFLLRGHVRESLFDKNLVEFIKKFKAKHEVDLYVHTWNESEAKSSWRSLQKPRPINELDVKNYFNEISDSVRKIIVDDDTSIDAFINGRVDGNICRIPRIAWKRMWYGIQKCMVEILKSEKKYDAIINTRFDILNFFHFNGVDKNIWRANNLIKVVDDFFDSGSDINFVYDFEHICIDNFYIAKPDFMRELIWKFNKDLDDFDFLVRNYDHGHEKLVFKIAKMMQSRNPIVYEKQSEYQIFINKWKDADAPGKDLILEYMNICKNLMFQDEDVVLNVIDILKKNINKWALNKSEVYRNKSDFLKKSDLTQKNKWYVSDISGEGYSAKTSGSTTGMPFEYLRWETVFHEIEWDNHYNIVLDEFNVSSSPHILYFFSSFYKTKDKEIIHCPGGSSELTMNNHGSTRAPTVHYVNFEMYKSDAEKFFAYLFDYLENNQIEVFFASSPEINSMCNYLRKFGVRKKLSYLLSTTSERLLPEDAVFLLEGGYFDHICDHMRCWDGGATFFTCKHRNYHLMDNLAWCEEGPNQELICTDYFNLASPFVRYWNGDYCRIAREYHRCECGRLYRDFEFLESRPFSLKGTNMREIQEKIKSLAIGGIKQVRCSVHDLSVVSTRNLTDDEKNRIKSVSDKFQFKFICEPF